MNYSNFFPQTTSSLYKMKKSQSRFLGISFFWLILGLWLFWLTIGEIPIKLKSEQARIEPTIPAQLIYAPTTGTIQETLITLNKEVEPSTKLLVIKKESLASEAEATPDQLREIYPAIKGRVVAKKYLVSGSHIKSGDWLLTIEPPTSFFIVGYFTPAQAYDLIRPGQIARFKGQGFPQNKYGELKCQVEKVSLAPMQTQKELNLVEVEFLILPDISPHSRVFLKSGIEGEIEIEIEKTTPIKMILKELGLIKK